MSGLGGNQTQDKEWAKLRGRGFNPEELMSLAYTLEYFGLYPDELDALCRAGAPRYWTEAPEGDEYGVFFHPVELRHWLAKVVIHQGPEAA